MHKAVDKIIRKKQISEKTLQYPKRRIARVNTDERARKAPAKEEVPT